MDEADCVWLTESRSGMSYGRSMDSGHVYSPDVQIQFVTSPVRQAEGRRSIWQALTHHFGPARLVHCARRKEPRRTYSVGPRITDSEQGSTNRQHQGLKSDPARHWLGKLHHGLGLSKRMFCGRRIVPWTRHWQYITSLSSVSVSD
jgi:hypothetical protein